MMKNSCRSEKSIKSLRKMVTLSVIFVLLPRLIIGHCYCDQVIRCRSSVTYEDMYSLSCRKFATKIEFDKDVVFSPCPLSVLEIIPNLETVTPASPQICHCLKDPIAHCANGNSPPTATPTSITIVPTTPVIATIVSSTAVMENIAGLENEKMVVSRELQMCKAAAANAVASAKAAYDNRLAQIQAQCDINVERARQDMKIRFENEKGQQVAALAANTAEANRCKATLDKVNRKYAAQTTLLTEQQLLRESLESQLLTSAQDTDIFKKEIEGLKTLLDKTNNVSNMEAARKVAELESRIFDLRDHSAERISRLVTLHNASISDFIRKVADLESQLTQIRVKADEHLTQLITTHNSTLTNVSHELDIAKKEVMGLKICLDKAYECLDILESFNNNLTRLLANSRETFKDATECNCTVPVDLIERVDGNNSACNEGVKCGFFYARIIIAALLWYLLGV